MGPATLSDMPTDPDALHSEQVNARITKDMLRTIDAMAEEEDRSRSLMIRRLLSEAITARQAKEQR